MNQEYIQQVEWKEYIKDWFLEINCIINMSNFMFKGFNLDEGVSSKSQVKGSVSKNIKKNLVTQYPRLEQVIDSLLPKKEPVVIAKCKDGVSVLITESQGACFFQYKNDHWFPTLK